jgi:hypothetical protein
LFEPGELSEPVDESAVVAGARVLPFEFDSGPSLAVIWAGPLLTPEVACADLLSRNVAVIS